MNVLPPGFVPRSNTNTAVNVTPLPPHLQARIADSLSSKQTKDLVSLLSQGHLQYLYSHFLGSKRDVEDDDKHPTWSALNNLIRDNSDTSDIPEAPEGLTMTMNTCFREYATNISNMWSGNLYEKSLDHLLRVLLRIHLAPIREQKRKGGSTTTDNTERPQNQHQPGHKAMRRKEKYKILNLCNDLATATSPSKIQKIVSELAKLGAEGPGAGSEATHIAPVGPMGQDCEPEDEDEDEDEVYGNNTGDKGGVKPKGNRNYHGPRRCC
jgi:hypothetical protein